MTSKSDIRLLLVRSGATEWDEAGRVQGSTDLPMCESGRGVCVQGLKDFAMGEGWKPGVAAHGPDEASAQTAGMLSRMTGARKREVEELREMDLGLWEGQLDDQLEERYPSAYGQWREDPSSVQPPDGERLGEVEARLLRALDRIAEKAAKPVVAVVLRPIVFGMAACLLKGEPVSGLWEYAEGEAGVLKIEDARARLRERAAGARGGE